MDNSNLIYKQTAADIKRSIESGDISGRLPGERDLAQQYNVSRVTIRHALELLLESHVIHRVARKGTFTGRPDAGSELPEVRRIGFLIFGARGMSVYESMLLSGLSRAGSDGAYQVFVENFADTKNLHERFPVIRRMDRPDICILCGDVTPVIAEYISNHEVPVILTNRFAASELTGGYDTCSLDWYNWGYRAARYLISGDYRRVALITGELTDRKNQEILAGVKAAHEEDDLTFAADLIVYCRNESMQSGLDAALMLGELGYPDAIIAGAGGLGNGAVLGAAHFAAENPVPIVSTSENSESRLSSYPLHFLNYDPDDAVKKCLRLIERRLNNTSVQPETLRPVWRF